MTLRTPTICGPVDHALRITITDSIKTCSHERMVRDLGRWPHLRDTLKLPGPGQGRVNSGPADGQALQHLDFGLLGSSMGDFSAQQGPVFRPAIQSYIALLEKNMTLLPKATCFFERAEHSCMFIRGCQTLAIGKP